MNDRNMRLCALTLVFCLFAALPGCKTQPPAGGDGGAASEQAAKYAPLASEGGWDVAAQNERFELLFDPAACGVAVKDRQTGALWKSSPGEDELASVASDEVRGEYLSGLSVEYYDSREKATVLQSWADCVRKGQFELYAVKNGVRVVYTLGEVSRGVLPTAVSASTFAALEKEFDAGTYARIKRFYDLTSLPGMTESLKEFYLKAYPILEKEDIYLLRKVGTRIEEELLGYFRQAGIGSERVYGEYDKIGMQYQVSETVSFVIPVEYTLADDGFNASVDTAEIAYDKTKYKLTTLSLLPFFGCADEADKGFIFLPDGSGALVDLSAQSEQMVSLKIYGDDAAMRKSRSVISSQPVPLPVFGMQKGADAFLALVEAGAEIGTVRSRSGNAVYPKDSVSCEFTLRSRESYSSGKKLNAGERFVYAPQSYGSPVRIRYFLLPQNAAGYAGMAQKLREHVFADSEKSEGGPSLYLDLYGAVTRQERFLSCKVDRLRALTTFSQAQEIVKQLTDGGVRDLALRLLNWQGAKSAMTVRDAGKPAGVLGGAGGLSSLTKFLKERNVSLFLDYDPLLRQKAPFGGLQSALNANGRVVYDSDKRLLLEDIGSLSTARLALNQKSVSKAVDKTEASLGRLGVSAVSLSSAASRLYTDYNDTAFATRSDMAALAVRLAGKAAGGRQLMLDGGNYYMLSLADHIVDLPSSNSSLYVESASVPFLQILLHGYVSYAGAPINLSDDSGAAVLKMIEYGALPRFSLIHAEPFMVKNTQYTELYSAHWADWTRRILTLYEQTEDFLRQTKGQRITEHFSPAPGVYVTRYENGAYSAVNYGGSPAVYGGKTVGPMGFAFGGLPGGGDAA